MDKKKKEKKKQEGVRNIFLPAIFSLQLMVLECIFKNESVIEKIIHHLNFVISPIVCLMSFSCELFSFLFLFFSFHFFVFCVFFVFFLNMFALKRLLYFHNVIFWHYEQMHNFEYNNILHCFVAVFHSSWCWSVIYPTRRECWISVLLDSHQSCVRQMYWEAYCHWSGWILTWNHWAVWKWSWDHYWGG